MTSAHRRYIVVETVISVVINTVLSIGFFWAVFGGQQWVSVAALIPDAVPQSFMITLMSTLVPTLLTRRRVRAGGVAAMSRGIPRVLRLLPVRAVAGAVVAAAAGFAVHSVVLDTFAPGGLSFGAALMFKAFYGALLAAIVTPIILPMALSDGSNRRHG